MSVMGDLAFEQALARATGIDPAKLIPEEELDARRAGWLSCYGCATEGPYRMFFGHPYCATCVREGVPWSENAIENPERSAIQRARDDEAMDEWMNSHSDNKGEK